MTQHPYTSQGVSSCLRLKCDGSFDPVTGLTGGGDAVKDIEGTILIEGRFPCVATSTLMAVALALLEGLFTHIGHMDGLSPTCQLHQLQPKGLLGPQNHNFGYTFLC